MSIFKAYDIRGVYGKDLAEGDFYKIESTGKYLTKEQIRNIATSL